MPRGWGAWGARRLSVCHCAVSVGRVWRWRSGGCRAAAGKPTSQHDEVEEKQTPNSVSDERASEPTPQSLQPRPRLERASMLQRPA